MSEIRTENGAPADEAAQVREAVCELPEMPSVPLYREPIPTVPRPEPEPAETLRTEIFPKDRFEPVSTGGFVGIMLLAAIPVPGLLFLIVWACGGCRKINKRNYARAALIVIAAVLALTLLIGMVLAFAQDGIRFTEGF